TLKVNQKVKATNQNLPEKTYDFDVKSGINTAAFSMDTLNLGINQFNIQLFYKVHNNLIPSNQFIFNYNVVDKMSGITEPIVVYTNATIYTPANPPPTTTPPPTSKTVLYIIIGIGVLWALTRLF
ncbi:MAG: hypothetical protein AABY22_34565, partial [Nanoarchaeota archaeon]